MHLYWITSQVDDYDWFVVAKTSRIAKSFYSTEEGCSFKEAHARRLVKLDIPDGPPDWPSSDILKMAKVDVNEFGEGRRLVTFKGEVIKDNRNK